MVGINVLPSASPLQEVKRRMQIQVLGHMKLRDVRDSSRPFQ